MLQARRCQTKGEESAEKISRGVRPRSSRVARRSLWEVVAGLRSPRDSSSTVEIGEKEFESRCLVELAAPSCAARSLMTRKEAYRRSSGVRNHAVSTLCGSQKYPTSATATVIPPSSKKRICHECHCALLSGLASCLSGKCLNTK